MDQNLYNLHMQVLSDSTYSYKQKKGMLHQVRKLTPADQNRWNFRFVLIPIMAIALTIPIYVLFQMAKGVNMGDITIPEALVSLGSTALGALAAFFTHYVRSQEETPQGTHDRGPGPGPNAITPTNTLDASEESSSTSV